MASGDITYTESQGEVLEVREVGRDNGYPNVPRPRLCHLRRWEGMTYGFNLISKKDTSGHFIDNIDYGFPAYYSGLKDGDRVVEVDGVDVTDMPHRDVVNMIKVSGKDGVKMLVVDIETERYFRDKGYTIKSNSNNYQIEFVACPLVKPDGDSNNSSMKKVVNQEVVHRDGHGKSKKKSNQRDSSLFKRFSDPEPPTLQELPVKTVYETLAVPDSNSRTTIVNGMTGASAKRQPNIPNTKVVAKASTPASTDGWTASGAKTQPVARLCHLIKSPYEPFGFVLRTYQDTNEKMIVKLDKNAIAQRTGLKEMDYVIEINGVNVAKENHNQVTARIHSLGNELSLLVVGVKDMQWFRRQSIVPRAKDCLVFKTDKPGKGRRDNLDDSSNGKTHAGRVLNAIEQEPSTAESEEFQLKDYNSSESNGPKEEFSEAVVASDENSQANGSSLADTLNMTAAEARQRIAEGAKKKQRKNRAKQGQGRKPQENVV